jgi:hypothetical protein
MKHHTILLCLLTSLALTSAAHAAITVNVPPDVPDMPAYTTELLEERLELLTGDEVTISERTRIRGLIRLNVDESLEPMLGSEGFRIVAGAGGADITAAAGPGLLYGSCQFIEWIMGQTTEDLLNERFIDIDWPVKKGQAAEFIHNMPDYGFTDRPFYSERGFELTNLALGVADLIDIDKTPEKYNPYSGIEGGFDKTIETWKRWCDWAARHRANFITNWPYSSGTNWWELANEPATEGMSIYTPEEIEKAAEVREELLDYAHSRGLRPYLMNYVPGAPTPTIREKHPDIIGERIKPHYPLPFSLSKPKTTELFTKQVAAIFERYPNLGGLHLRWWGESFLSDADKPILAELTLAMMQAAKQVNPDAAFIMSGFRHSGGRPELAQRFPAGVTLQAKWGYDWEPVPDPLIPMDQICNFGRPLMISQNLPGEEYHSIGGVQYRSLERGIKKYAFADDQVPNLAGFATVAAELDHEWITVVNYITMARLNWDPKRTNVDELIKNHLAVHYGPKAAEPIFMALELTQDEMERFMWGFAGICPYVIHYRSHNMFGLQRIQDQPINEIRKGRDQVAHHAGQLNEALRKLQMADNFVKLSGKESFRDLLLQTKWFADFMWSRQLLAEAFIALHERDFDTAVAKLEEVKRISRGLEQLGMGKPNISDDFEFEGMTRPRHLKQFVDQEVKQIDELISPENIRKLEQSRVIHGQPETIAVRGQVGSRFPVSFAIPAELDDLKSAKLVLTVSDLDGNAPGDEAAVVINNAERQLAPTGDGQTKEYTFEIETGKLKAGDSFEIEYILSGKPGGTAGYNVRDSRLELQTW